MTALIPSRLRHAPRVRLAGSAAVTDGALEVRVDGLVCGVCAARTASALRSVPGVEAATVDLAAGRASVRLREGAAPDEAAMQAAVERVVIGMGVRRWLERRLKGRDT
ncbi:MAG: hypothetical protein AMXMBFR23_22730 [Chloroflexota bacterium]